jgi:hypothetical protein
MKQWHFARGPLTWTGRGASRALAEVVSTSLRHLGVAAWAAAPEEVQGPTAWVSRCGHVEGSHDLLLTEHHGQGARIVVRAEDEPSDAWFPAGWQLAVLKSLAAAFDAELPSFPAPQAGVLVVPAGAPAVATLLDAAADKLGIRPWRVTTPGDFGHGPLARVAVESQPVRILGEASVVESWAKETAGVETSREPIPPGSPLPPCLIAYAWVLGGLREAAKGAARPFPDNFDTLRRRA